MNYDALSFNFQSTMDIQLARALEEIEAAAYIDLLRAAPAEWQCATEKSDAGCVLIAPPADALLFNRILACGLRRPVERLELKTLITRLRAGGASNYGVQLAPVAASDGIAEWLAREGLVARDRWAKVYRPAGNVAPVTTDLRIESAGADHAGLFADITTKGFGMPPQWRSWIAATVGLPRWHHYLAWNGEEAVAAAALFICDDVGWLGIGSTLPSARRRGAQGALMARRLLDGAALGCQWFVTETGEETPQRPNASFRNMIRAGFEVAYHRPNYMPPAR
jgi:hypothetical protein